MDRLEVTGLDGTRIVETPGELAAALTPRSRGGNHFMISTVGVNYPMLDVLIQDDAAVIHYFPAEGSAGHQSYSKRVDLPDEVAFPANLTGEPLLLPGSTVIATTTALRCIDQFANNRTRPSLIDWQDL